jgi:hypothetical protein
MPYPKHQHLASVHGTDNVTDKAAGGREWRITPSSGTGGQSSNGNGLLELEAPALAVAVGGVRRDPGERDLVGDCPADHRLGHGRLRGEGDVVVDARPAAAVPVVRPGRGQIQTAVDRVRPRPGA